MAYSAKWRKNRRGGPAQMEIWEAGEAVKAGDILIAGTSGGSTSDEAYLINETGEKVLGAAMNDAADGADVAVVLAGRDDVFELISQASDGFDLDVDTYQTCQIQAVTSGAMTFSPSTAGGGDVRMLGRVLDGASGNADATNANHFLGVFQNTYYEN